MHIFSFIETTALTRRVQEYLSDDEYRWMLTIYPKDVADSISASMLTQIRKEIDDGQV